MSLWLRVFGTNDVQPDPAALQQVVQAIAPDATIQFEQGDNGWQRAEIRLAATRRGAEAPLYLERFRRDEEGIRDELQAWAAWLETCDYSDNYPRLMQHMTSTQQVFTLRRPLDCGNEIMLDNVCTAICQFIARATEGVYQVDQQGFYSSDGTMVLQEY